MPLPHIHIQSSAKVFAFVFQLSFQMNPLFILMKYAGRKGIYIYVSHFKTGNKIFSPFALQENRDAKIQVSPAR